MRIVFVSNNYTPYSGGVVSSINATIAQLQKHGHEVLLVTLDFLGKHEHDKHDPPWVVRVTCPITFWYKENCMAIPWRPAHHLNQYIADFSPDIVHVHHPFLLGDSALHAARKQGVPVVFTYHTFYEHYLHYVPLPKCLLAPCVKKKVLSFCSKVDHIIAPSRAIQGLLFARIPEKKITVIPSGLQEVFIPAYKGSKKCEDGAPFHLLTVGRFVKEKNVALLLDVFSRIASNKYRFTLVGYGAEFDALKHYAYTTLGLSDAHVCFMYKPDKNSIAQLYAQADLFLFSSQSDTQGLVLAEAMVSGTPVVALDGPGQRDIIQEGVNGFLVHDARQMEQRIQEIARDKLLHERLCHCARKTGLRYTPEKTIKRLLNCYDSLG